MLLKNNVLNMFSNTCMLFRYQVPLPVNETPEKSGWSADTDEKLVFKYTNDSVFSFNIQRKSDAVKIWDTSIGYYSFNPLNLLLTAAWKR